MLAPSALPCRSCNGVAYRAAFAGLQDSAFQRSGSRSLLPRPHDFWKQFKVQVYNSEGPLSPSASRGHANSSCGRAGCALIGATIELEFPATAFASDSATIEVDPPEGDRVSVNFDLSSIR